MTTVAHIQKLRALALSVTRGDLRHPWSVQTSNSFRRIGTDRGDGDVLCATTQSSDGHPDLHAAADVLDYIVAAHPFVVLELLDQRDRAWHALDYLRHKIRENVDAIFAEAEAMRSGDGAIHGGDIAINATAANAYVYEAEARLEGRFGEEGFRGTLRAELTHAWIAGRFFNPEAP